MGVTSDPENRTMQSIHTRAALTAALLLLPIPVVAGAQPGRGGADQRRDSIARLPGGMSVVFGGSSNRAVLGVTLGAASRADTNGVRIEEVQADGPAARAGLKAGDVITEINGVSLRVSPADADDPALAGLAQRRLTRTLAKAKPGDNVELRVGSGGSSRTVSLKSVSAAELDRSRTTTTYGTGGQQDENRGVIGLSVGGAGNLRDTLGLFISAVVSDGPADRAGVIEGERIASVNGVDVRVPREDVEDIGAVTARANRFIREVQKVAPGGNVSLRVYSGGRYRDVSVRAVKSSELPRQGFRMSIGDGSMIFSLPRTPDAFNGTTVFPRGDLVPMMPGRIRIDRDGIEIDRETMERATQEIRRRVQELGRDFRLELTRPDGSSSRDGERVVRYAPRL
jgi:serine protease Do